MRPCLGVGQLLDSHDDAHDVLRHTSKGGCKLTAAEQETEEDKALQVSLGYLFDTHIRTSEHKFTFKATSLPASCSNSLFLLFSRLWEFVPLSILESRRTFGVVRLHYAMGETQVSLKCSFAQATTYHCSSIVCAVEYCIGPSTLGSCVSAGPGVFKTLNLPIRNECCSYRDPKKCFNDWGAAHSNISTETIVITTTYTRYGKISTSNI
jgi:hypothetical protein